MSASVENWLSRLKQSRNQIKNAKSHMSLFLKWLRENGGQFKDYTPDELVQYQRNADNGHRYDILDLLQRYILSLKGRSSTKAARYTKMRSFFMHNRADLPADRSFKIRGDEPKINGDLSAEEARKIILGSKPMYQAVFLSMFQGGMGAHELIYWSNNGLKQLVEDLQGNPQTIKIVLPGRKGEENERSFYTFIGSDAIDALRKYMAERPGNKGNAIFITRLGHPIGYFALQSYWRLKVRTLGIGPKGIKNVQVGKGSHEMRDLFRTQWAKSPAKPEIAEFMMGHAIDPLQYNKSFRDEKFYRDEYLKALPYLNLLSSGRPFHQVDEEEVESLRREVERLKQVQESRRESDEVMDRLFANPKFLEVLRERLKELKT